MIPLEVMGKLSKIISMAFRLFGNVLGGAVVYHLILSLLFAYQEQFLIAVLVGGALWLLIFKFLQVDQSRGIGRVINFFVQCLFAIAWVQMFFGVFESLIQSFVIAMLSMTYLALNIHHDRQKDREGISWN